MGASPGWDSLHDDIRLVREQLDDSEHAEADDRVTDRAAYLAAQERRRRRLAQLEQPKDAA